MSRLPKPGARAPRGPGGPAEVCARSSDDRGGRGTTAKASRRGRCWVTRRYVWSRRFPPPPRAHPRKFRDRFPALFPPDFGVRAAARPKRAGHRPASRVCLHARGRAPTDGRANHNTDPRVPAGVPRASRPDERAADAPPPIASSRLSRARDASSRRGSQTPLFFFLRAAGATSPALRAFLRVAAAADLDATRPLSTRAGQGSVGRARGGGEHAHRGRGGWSVGQSAGRAGVRAGRRRRRGG